MTIKVVVNEDQNLKEDTITFNVRKVTNEMESLISIIKD